MDIKNIAVNLQKIAFQGKPNTGRVFLTAPEDRVTISRQSAEDAANYIKSMKKSNGNPRFSEKEMNLFSQCYEAGTIDKEVVEKFAKHEDLKMNSIQDIWQVKHDTKNPDFYENLEKTISDFGENKKVKNFAQSIFVPNKEFTLEINDKDSKKYTYEATSDGNKLIDKGTSYINSDVNGVHIIKTSENYKNNTEVIKDQILDEDNIPYTTSVTTTKKDKNGNMLRKEEMTQSDIPGVFNVKYTYANGKTKDVSKATVNDNTGIKTIKKDMKSENGTRTEFLYEDDPNGNRIVDYKITNKDGKVLMKNSQSFEIIDDNKFISSKNHRKYEITTDEKGMKIKDLSHDTETSIDFKKKCKGNVKELVSLLKKVPGEELFETVDSIKKMNGKDKDKLLESYFTPIGKKINIGDDLFVFLHELGHAKDGEHQKLKDVLLGKNNKVYCDDPDIQKTFIKERETFNKYHDDNERDMISYFTQAKGHYQGQWGGLSEVIAETNALTNTYTGENVKCLGDRAQLLQQHFPETIAAIKNAMEYKNDIAAIEYYGT